MPKRATSKGAAAAAAPPPPSAPSTAAVQGALRELLTDALTVESSVTLDALLAAAAPGPSAFAAALRIQALDADGALRYLAFLRYHWKTSFDVGSALALVGRVYDLAFEREGADGSAPPAEDVLADFLEESAAVESSEAANFERVLRKKDPDEFLRGAMPKIPFAAAMRLIVLLVLHGRAQPTVAAGLVDTALAFYDRVVEEFVAEEPDEDDDED